MPAYVAARAQTMLNSAKKPMNGSSVLLLGVTYKANISDERETPARPLAKRLIAMGADVSFFDSHVSEFEVDGQELTKAIDLGVASEAADLVILVQTHDDIMAAAPFDGAAHVLDTRGALNGPNVERL
jgi:UDP-N-acetyl-D-mannosaminuronate dehydrogenase